MKLQLGSKIRVVNLVTFLIVIGLSNFSNRSAFALITGGVGNEPLKISGWPEGAGEIFNHQSRIAWWEGPPFGGGQYHAEYRGNAKTVNTILVQFSKLKVKTKRVFIHDGVGASFWLNPNRAADKKVDAKMDFRFMVWSRDNWERLIKMPAHLNPVGKDDPKNGPPAQLDIYTGGNIHWSDLDIPSGLSVTDNRLEAHGFTTADGVVLEGKIVDLESKEPIAAELQLELIEPRKTGGYDYRNTTEITADKKGRFVFKKVPPGWYRIVANASRYVPRIIGHIKTDGQPRWHWYSSELSRPTVVFGHLTEGEEKPLPDVHVRLTHAVTKSNARYESPLELSTKTKADGSFRIENVPVGKVSIRISKVGYCRPGLSPSVSTPAEGVKLQMMKSAFLRITVDFGDKERPKAYIVNLEPEGGNAVGKWGGSGIIDENNERIFKNVPPGRYVVFGHPNPTKAAQKTEKIPVELKGGKVKKVVLKAK